MSDLHMVAREAMDRRRSAVAAVAAALRASEFNELAFSEAWFECQQSYAALGDALRQVARTPPPPAHRPYIAGLVLKQTNEFASAASADARLAAARALLPRYTGPALTLYRAASLAEHRSGRYSISWTKNPIVALGYAALKGGCVTLTTVAPPAAIVGVYADIEADRSEEVFVNPSLLEVVSVLDER